MARISYDEQTAEAFKSVREIPREALSGWREAVRRHLRPLPDMTMVDIGGGTGMFAAAFADWFGIEVIAVEPSAAMRGQVPRTPAIDVLEGQAGALPLPDGSVHAAWLSLVLHHVADLGTAAHEIRRVLRPGAPVLLRQGFPGRVDGIELLRGSPRPLARSTPIRRSRRLRGVRRRRVPPGRPRTCLGHLLDEPCGVPRPGGHLPPRGHHHARPH